MSGVQQALIIVAIVFFFIPFIVWTITRFRTRVLQRYAPWHRLSVIIAFGTCIPIFLILLLVAILAL
ncbi:hypothetical protein [Spiroplasma eriocheiris]|uniref:hypothetical protein n=1 Tax=Spiroplasma eriocheiris TaxID=315358 RepID=UPI0011DC8273|nr:hypothetical protein [Spiroplasma eriocheiris]